MPILDFLNAWFASHPWEQVTEAHKIATIEIDREFTRLWNEVNGE